MKGAMRSLILLVVLSGTLGEAWGAEGVKLKVFPSIYTDEKGVALRNPEGVATDGQSNLAVADTGNGRIVVYSITADTVRARLAIQLPEVLQPVRVQFAEKGELLVLDGKIHRIARVSPEGVFLGFLEVQGATGPVVPASLKVGSDGLIYLLDLAGARVLVLDSTGKVQRDLPFPQETGFALDLAVGPRGTVFLLDGVERRVFTFPPGSTRATLLGKAFTEEAAFPAALAADDRGQLFLADQGGGGIIALGPDGSFRGRPAGMGWKEGLLRYPTGLCFDGYGHLFVADRGNHRVQVFALVP